MKTCYERFTKTIKPLEDTERALDFLRAEAARQMAMQRRWFKEHSNSSLDCPEGLQVTLEIQAEVKDD